MPEYDKPDLRAGNVPNKPRNYDEAAKAFGDAEQREIQRNKDIGRQHDAEIQGRREAQGRRAEGTSVPGPAERMHNRDRLVNTQEQKNERTNVRTELTSAQLTMREKREAARQVDIQVSKGHGDPDKTIAELSNKAPQFPSR